MAKKILVIEDNEKNRLLMTDILEFRGYEILQTEDGEEGLKIATEQNPDLILLDMQMPVMDGFSFVNNIRSKSELKHIKIIAVTSFAMKGDKEKMLRVGADDYVSKPIDTRHFPKLVEKHIGSA